MIPAVPQPAASLSTSMRGVTLSSPPASILAQATAIVTNAAAAIPPGRSGGAVALLTNTGWNTAIVQKAGDQVTVVLWIGKPDSWDSGLAYGAAVVASW